MAKFPLLIPVDFGLLGFADLGRVYVDGDSPGGWHNAAGGGFWAGALNPALSFGLMFTTNSAHHVVTTVGFAF